MLVDGAPLRKKARDDYERVLHELNQARNEVERFETQDKPGFVRWMTTQFGSLITELRETDRLLMSKRDLLFQIEAESFFTGVSPGQAYKRVMAHREKGDTENEAADIPFDESDDFGFGEEGPEPDPWDDPFDPNAETGPKQQQRRQRNAPAKRNNPTKSTARLKELYRALARRLHPDTCAQPSNQKLEWWHQAQQAYQDGDADQLELILTWCEIAEKGAAAETSVSLLMRITRQFSSSLRSLKQQLARHRHDVAWNFSKLTNLKPLAARLERELRSELSEMKMVLKRIEQQLDKIAEAACRLAKRPRRRRSHPEHSEFEF